VFPTAIAQCDGAACFRGTPSSHRGPPLFASSSSAGREKRKDEVRIIYCLKCADRQMPVPVRDRFGKRTAMRIVATGLFGARRLVMLRRLETAANAGDRAKLRRAHAARGARAGRSSWRARSASRHAATEPSSGGKRRGPPCRLKARPATSAGCSARSQQQTPEPHPPRSATGADATIAPAKGAPTRDREWPGWSISSECADGKQRTSIEMTLRGP
jgi:hypothetical protein